MKAEITKGWPRPTGKCDMCNDKPARYWFGDTSVALCGAERCAERNKENWDRMIEEEKRDREASENGW